MLSALINSAVPSPSQWRHSKHHSSVKHHHVIGIPSDRGFYRVHWNVNLTFISSDEDIEETGDSREESRCSPTDLPGFVLGWQLREHIPQDYSCGPETRDHNECPSGGERGVRRVCGCLWPADEQEINGWIQGGEGQHRLAPSGSSEVWFILIFVRVLFTHLLPLDRSSLFGSVGEQIHLC